MALRLSFHKGSIFNSTAKVLVNPVNTKGAMGAGLALEFKKRFPNNFQVYSEYCKEHNDIKSYRQVACEDRGKIIYNMATKEHYKLPSNIAFIRRAMFNLRCYVHQITNWEDYLTIAMPAIGAGLGGLGQLEVLFQIYYQMRNVDFDIHIELYGFDKITKPMRDKFTKGLVMFPVPDRFTGVGSRKVDGIGQYRISEAAIFFAGREYILATGDAIGSDLTFRINYYDELAEVYAPLGKRRYAKQLIVVPENSNSYKTARKIAEKLHPAWRFIKDPMHKELHIRNVFQVLGYNLDTPSEFVLCWTPDGTEDKTTKKTGGTAMAIKVAKMFGIPVFNLHNDDCLERLSDYLGIANPFDNEY